jgi:hypothetical protein
MVDHGGVHHDEECPVVDEGVPVRSESLPVAGDRLGSRDKRIGGDVVVSRDEVHRDLRIDACGDRQELFGLVVTVRVVDQVATDEYERRADGVDHLHRPPIVGSIPFEALGPCFLANGHTPFGISLDRRRVEARERRITTELGVGQEDEPEPCLGHADRKLTGVSALLPAMPATIGAHEQDRDSGSR